VSGQQNKVKQRDLALDLRRFNYGFIQIHGSYDYEEQSFCVINHNESSDVFFGVMKELGRKYEQDSILLVPKGGDGYFWYCDSDEVEPLGGRFSLQDAADRYFSQIHGHRFRIQNALLTFRKPIFCGMGLLGVIKNRAAIMSSLGGMEVV
jgi:hypothetical protein